MSQNYGIIPVFRSTKISPLSKTRPAVHYILFVPPFGETNKDAVSIGARMEGGSSFEDIIDISESDGDKFKVKKSIL
ncbi:hypothetical protein [Kaistella jeonii]|uniref:Uncharacterized protein n=1 Tax=Kaistella jeonii TaxID=266749 RepID=A0A0C1FBP3_9FLAO|nr:hypothetical protein [Kaistella jeonii]KIA90512.1 hypothetical protein OA86_01105 [Kaistella jeonii]